jgi:hypothetical protein
MTKSANVKVICSAAGSVKLVDQPDRQHCLLGCLRSAHLHHTPSTFAPCELCNQYLPHCLSHSLTDQYPYWSVVLVETFFLSSSFSFVGLGMGLLC